MKNKAALVILIFAFTLLFCSCKNNQNKTITDLVYTSLKTDYCVYIKESSVYTPFFVLSNNYNGNTLLLRKDILEIPFKMNDYSSFYENSAIDEYLNTEYISHLDDVSEYIEFSTIEIADDTQ